MRYERIVFAQGEDAVEPLNILDDKGVGAAIDYLCRWHNPGEHEIADSPSAGTSDSTHRTGDGYVLSWNYRYGYIGLEKEVE